MGQNEGRNGFNINEYLLPLGAAPPHGIRYGPPGAIGQRPPVVMQPQQQVVQRPPIPRPLFHGHDQERKCKNDQH